MSVPLGSRLPRKHNLVLVCDDADADLRAKAWRLDHKGYLVTTIHIKKRTRGIVLAHRVIASRMANRTLLRTDFVDHINLNKTDNRRTNLRLTDKYGSAQNKPNNGFRGTTKHGGGKWQASVQHKGKFHYCGLFEKREDAAEASRLKRVELGFLGEAEK